MKSKANMEEAITRNKE